MPNNFKRHSMEAIETRLSEALSEFFGEKTFVSIEQLEVAGPDRKGVKLMALAGPERRTKLEPVHIALP